METEPDGEKKVIASKHWVLDKRVNVAAIVTFVVLISGQTYTALQWASKTDNRIGTLEDVVKENKADHEKVTVMGAKMDGLRDTLTDIKNNDLQDIKRALDHLTYPEHGK